jgi:hypothetical protein
MSRIRTAWAALGLCFAAPLYAGASFELALAEPCDGTADPAKKVLAPVVSELKAASGDIECYVAGSPVVLHATDVRATPDQYGAGSVEVTFTPASMRHWSHIRSTHLEKKLILLKGHQAVLNVYIPETPSESKFLLSASSFHEAEVIARVLRGED